MARLLEKELRAFPDQIKIHHPVEANAIFASLSPELIEALHQECAFYLWTPETFEARLMCSFDTTPENIQTFRNILDKTHAPKS
jgi:threonine aldolase